MCQMHRQCRHSHGYQCDCELDHELYLKRAIQLAYEAKLEGNGGFGAILVDEDGTILFEAKNEVVTSGDCTAHAEMLVVREASKCYEPHRLQKMKLYASCEPCVMCMGAIIWSQIGHVIFGMTEREMLNMTDLEVAVGVPSTAIVQCATVKPIISGPMPVLHDLARGVFE